MPNLLLEMHNKIQKAKKCNKCQNCIVRTGIDGKKIKLCIERFTKMFTMNFGVQKCKFYKKGEKQNV